jgi:GNAT superfamily N-acetyltransferase
MTIRIERLTAAALRSVLPDLARLRITVFLDFPYLYEGSQGYEERYLTTYAETPGSVVVVARDGDRVVGAATGVPLECEPDSIRQPFVERDLAVEEIFYFGESVLLGEYRGQGIGVEFFRHREAHARELGRRWAYFCGVDRPADHPRRPSGYVPLDTFWRRRGFEPAGGLTCYMSWRDIGEPEESRKPMRFWRKDLTR